MLYLSTTLCEPRPTIKATPESRLEDERMQLVILEASFAAKDDVSHCRVGNISDKIPNEAGISGGFYIAILGNKLLIYKMNVVNEVACVRALL